MDPIKPKPPTDFSKLPGFSDYTSKLKDAMKPQSKPFQAIWMNSAGSTQRKMLMQAEAFKTRQLMHLLTRLTSDLSEGKIRVKAPLQKSVRETVGSFPIALEIDGKPYWLSGSLTMFGRRFNGFNLSGLDADIQFYRGTMLFPPSVSYFNHGEQIMLSTDDMAINRQAGKLGKGLIRLLNASVIKPPGELKEGLPLVEPDSEKDLEY